MVSGRIWSDSEAAVERNQSYSGTTHFRSDSIAIPEWFWSGSGAVPRCANELRPYLVMHLSMVFT